MTKHSTLLAAFAAFAACATPPQSPMADISYHPIGVIRSPFSQQQGTPIQPVFAGPARGRVEVDPRYREALADLAGFERVWLLYDFARAGSYQEKVTPYRDTTPRGLFATRAPTRPNRIGISAVKLIAVEADGLVVEEIDVLDGTPLLDIKPYVPQFDAYPQAKAGWLEQKNNERTAADDRFETGKQP